MKLRTYQAEGVDFLAARQRALLTDLPRLGKTAQALIAATRLGVTEMAVVGPASVRDVWPYEGGMWAPGIKLRVQSYDQAAKRGEIPALPIIIFDEFHRMKNPRAKRSHLLIHPSVRQAEHVWALSGTPMPNGTHELFTICAAFWPAEVKALGIRCELDWWNLFTQYRIGDYGRQYLRPKNTELLRVLLAGKCLGRKWSDVFDQLAPVLWTTCAVQADGDHSALAKLCPGIDLILALGKIPANTSALRRAVGLEKCAGSLRVIEDSLVDNDEKAVVAFHHTDIGMLLETHLSMAGLRPVRVDGSTSASDRERLRRMFMEDAGVRVFLGQLDTIREGINLSVANTLHLVEPSWTPGYNEQVGMRIAHPDKTVPSTVVAHVLADSLDEDIMRVLERKSDGRLAL